MPSNFLAQQYTPRLTDARHLHTLPEILVVVSLEMGCNFFVLSHHVDVFAPPDSGIRLHNCPDDSSVWFDERRLGVTDPIHRASHLTARGFCSHEVPQIIRLSQSEERCSSTRGFTGSATDIRFRRIFLAKGRGPVRLRPLQECRYLTTTSTLPPWVGLFAFEDARRIGNVRPFDEPCRDRCRAVRWIDKFWGYFQHVVPENLGWHVASV